MKVKIKGKERKEKGMRGNFFNKLINYFNYQIIIIIIINHSIFLVI